MAECHNCSTVKNKVTDLIYDGLCPDCSAFSIMLRRFAESNIPVEYWDLWMEKHFHGEKILRKHYDLIINDFSTAYSRGYSPCFAGSYGVGKTMATCCVLKQACIKGYSCLYTTLSDIVFATLHPDHSERASARREMMSIDFLAIDEFDPRFMPPSDNASDLFGRTLENVFRTRSQNRLPTLMCTNSPNVVESFQGALKESLGSLVKGYVTNVIVMGDDFRKANPRGK